MIAFQRSRMLNAALELVHEHGRSGATVSAIVARSGVSRKTFYECFPDRDGCLLAAVNDSLEQLAALCAPIYQGDGPWSKRVRDALEVALGYLEQNRAVATLTLGYLVGAEPEDPRGRAATLAVLEGILSDGAREAGEVSGVSPLAGEALVGGALSLLHARLRAPRGELIALVSPLVSMAVLPFFGAAAARRELRRESPRVAPRLHPTTKSQFSELGFRLTYRTVGTLSAIAAEPGLSNTQVGVRVGIGDQGQISKLLARLAGLGLLENTGAGARKGERNAWHLTRRGIEVESRIKGSTRAPRQSGSYGG